MRVPLGVAAALATGLLVVACGTANNQHQAGHASASAKAPAAAQTRSGAPVPVTSSRTVSTPASTPSSAPTRFTAPATGISTTGITGPVPSSYACALLSPTTWLKVIGTSNNQSPSSIGWNWAAAEGVYDCTGTFDADATQPDAEVMAACGQIAQSLNAGAPVGQITSSKKEMRELTSSGVYVMIQGSWSTTVSANDAQAALLEALGNAAEFGCPK